MVKTDPLMVIKSPVMEMKDPEGAVPVMLKSAPVMGKAVPDSQVRDILNNRSGHAFRYFESFAGPGV